MQMLTKGFQMADNPDGIKWLLFNFDPLAGY
jgi:hypothetical protein